MAGNKRGILITALLLVVLLGAGPFVYRSLASRIAPAEPAATAETTEAAEDTATADDAAEQRFLLADYDATVYTEDGDAVTLTQLADGRPLVINFWATWCPYCVEELPDFQQIVADYGDDVSFAFVDATDGGRETVEVASEYLVENGFTDLPAYYDTNLDAQIMYGVRSLPTTVVVSADGEIIGISAGRIDPAMLRGVLEQLV